MSNAQTIQVQFFDGTHPVLIDVLEAAQAACFCKNGCNVCRSKARGETRRQSLEESLNTAAERAGVEGGYKVERHDWQDCYRDRWGWKVTGPDEKRALNWIARATGGRVTESRVPVGYPTEWVHTNYVETGSYYVGE